MKWLDVTHHGNTLVGVEGGSYRARHCEQSARFFVAGEG